MRLPVTGTISRRRFARGMIATLIGSLAITLPWLSRPATPGGLGALIRHRTSAARIGHRYLATLPAGTDRSGLLAMSPALDRARRAVRRQPEVAVDLLREGIHDDFRRADIVILDGWVLSATEARLCALIALA
jgi:hypothetical protein